MFQAPTALTPDVSHIASVPDCCFVNRNLLGYLGEVANIPFREYKPASGISAKIIQKIQEMDISLPIVFNYT